MDPVASCLERGLASYEWSIFVLKPAVEARHHILPQCFSAGRYSETFLNNCTALNSPSMGEVSIG